MRQSLLLALACLVGLLTDPVRAQAPDDEARPVRATTAVGVRQEHVQRMMQDLEQSVRDQSGCKPTFKCFKLDDMDKNCFNKN